MEPTTINVNFFIATLVRNDMESTAIHELLVTAWGAECVCSLRHVQRLAKEFNDGDRDSIKRKGGSGRRRTSRSAENVETIRQLIEDNPRLSTNALSVMTEIEETAVRRILHKDLNKKSVCAKWIPHTLTDLMKQNRVTGCQTILDNINGSVMVIDEKWLYANPLPANNNIRSWVDAGGDRPTQPRRIISDQKYHILVAINFRGEHYSEVLERGQSVNAERYIAFLQNIIDVRRRGNLVIMHDNARPHKAQVTTTFLADNHIATVPQPAYSPDVNLLDRFIFRNMEVSRRNTSFPSVDAARRFVDNYLETFSRRQLTNELAALREDLQKIIRNGGDYL